MPAGSQNENNAGGGGFIVMSLMVLIGGYLMWRVAGPSVYYRAGQMAYYMLLPFDWIGFVHEYRRHIPVDVMQQPDLGLTISWINAAWRIPAAAFAAFVGYLSWKTWHNPIVRMRGEMSVDALLLQQARIHPAIAPVVLISRQMHKNEDERWHESYRPHEVVEKFGLADPISDEKDEPEAESDVDLVEGQDAPERVDADPSKFRVGSGAVPVKKVQAYPKLNRERTEAYFLSQLGTRVYFPGQDKPGTVFVDRLNPWEKTIFALFAPLAIKRTEGIEEHQALRDALNRSAVNAKQMPTLSLANKLYQEYRTHPQFSALFLRHHYSVTFLMEVYRLSKRAGKSTTADVYGWLRPNQTGLYAALNCVGRHVTFPENAGAYSHWLFEKDMNRRKRMPFLPVVAPVVQSLEEEWDFWNTSVERESEESLWGRMTADRHEADYTLFRRYVRDIMLRTMEVPPDAESSDSSFDESEGEAREAAEDKFLTEMMGNVRQAFGVQDPATNPSTKKV